MNARRRIEAALAGGGSGRWGGWAVVALWGLLLVPFAGTRNLYYEEGRYALAALDVLQHGHWLRPEVLGEGFVAKPPLLFWLVASAVSLGGVSEWVVRTPALLAALLGALLVEREARRRGGAPAGLLAAVAFLLSPYVLTTGARSEPDLFVSVASFGAFTIWLESRSTRQGSAILPWLALAALPLSRAWRRRVGFDASLAGPFALYAVGCTVPLAFWPHALARYAMPALVVRLAWLAAIPFDSARDDAARRLAGTLAAPLRASRDPLLILGPAIDDNAAFYLQRAGHSPRMVRTPGEVVPPAWLITAAPSPPGAREVARAAGRRGVVYGVYRVEPAD